MCRASLLRGHPEDGSPSPCTPNYGWAAACAHRTKSECPGSAPDHLQCSLIRVSEICFFAQRSGHFEVRVAEMPRHWEHVIFGCQNLLNTDLINEVFAF